MGPTHGVSDSVRESTFERPSRCSIRPLPLWRRPCPVLVQPLLLVRSVDLFLGHGWSGDGQENVEKEDYE